MAQTVGRLADRLLSVVVPKATASATWQEFQCLQCDQFRRGLWTRLCDQWGCTSWFSAGGCGSC